MGLSKLQPISLNIWGKSPYEAKFIRLQSPEFFRILRERLGWGLGSVLNLWIRHVAMNRLTAFQKYDP